MIDSRLISPMPLRRLHFGGAPMPQPVPSTPAPPPPVETPPEINDPPVPHEHEPVRDPLPVERNSNDIIH
jgi:hypothetical protein